MKSLILLYVCFVFSSCGVTKFEGGDSSLSSSNSPSPYGQGPASSDQTQQSDIPNNAITKGSFTVWTEPQDPAPYQPYVIVIQVVYGGSVFAITPGDLYGNVIGTDGYRQQLGQTHSYGIPIQQKFEKIYDGQRVYVSVPGTYQNVRDRISIGSLGLNEQQVIEITF